MGISLEHVLKLKKIDNKINDLYELKKKALKSIRSAMVKSGKNEVVFELPEELQEDGKKFIRLQIIDNAKELLEGKTVYKATGFSLIDSKIDLLKNKPKA